MLAPETVHLLVAIVFGLSAGLALVALVAVALETFNKIAERRDK